METTQTSTAHQGAFQKMPNQQEYTRFANNGFTSFNVTQQQKIEKPFYAMPVKSKLRLSSTTREVLGIFDPKEYEPPKLNDVELESVFWGNLCKWAYRNDVVKPLEIQKFLRSNDNDQNNNATVIINQVMDSIEATATSSIKNAESIFNDCKLELGFKEWYNEGGCFQISYLTNGCFGADCDDNGEINDGMAIRMTTESFLSSICMPISHFPITIANKLFNIISDTATQSYKASSYRMMNEFGLVYLDWSLNELEDDAIDDFANEITMDTLPLFSKIIDEETELKEICNALTALAPKAIKKHGSDIKQIEAFQAIGEYLKATKCGKLFVDEPHTDADFCTHLKNQCKELARMIKHGWVLTKKQESDLWEIHSIFNRIADNYDSNENGNDAWIAGSDLSIYDCNYVSFCTDPEETFLNNSHENIMCIGEESCLKLNLHSEQSYAPLLNNIALIDRGLIYISQLLQK